MGLYVLLQPEEDADAGVVERAQGHPSLVISSGDARMTVQIAGREGGAEMAIRFARQLAEAAGTFADRCEALTRLAPLDFEALAATLGTTPEEVAEAAERENDKPSTIDAEAFTEVSTIEGRTR
ncbi:hypothetical protein ACFFSW_33515 [Saccharothrix longispora]|uniref:YbaB/EbfC DNA-binding family protein n=1 Tax=Saccharothrix longispora TaxID=33920 RepID=A0ABU1Q2F4_9PSEU|nr:hypothetical protein [Saccharothrix longispora]MDR6597065.1 hypothetical protein [Saccharothrix longispora]